MAARLYVWMKSATGSRMKSTWRVLRSMFDGVRELTGVELNDEALIQSRHDLMTVLLIGAHREKGELTEAEAVDVLNLFDKLRKLQLRAHNEDESARLRVEAIKRLVDDVAFEVATKDVEKIAGCHTRPSLARARAVQWLMRELERYVEPVQTDAGNNRDGAIQLCRNPSLPDEEMQRLITRHLKQGSSLQSLAIDILLQQEGYEGKDQARLYNDLKEHERWEQSNPDRAKHGNLAIFKSEQPAYPFSEGWRQRKPGSGGRRMRSKAEEF